MSRVSVSSLASGSHPASTTAPAPSRSALPNGAIGPTAKASPPPGPSAGCGRRRAVEPAGVGRRPAGWARFPARPEAVEVRAPRHRASPPRPRSSPRRSGRGGAGFGMTALTRRTIDRQRRQLAVDVSALSPRRPTRSGSPTGATAGQAVRLPAPFA